MNFEKAVKDLKKSAGWIATDALRELKSK